MRFNPKIKTQLAGRPCDAKCTWYCRLVHLAGGRQRLVDALLAVVPPAAVWTIFAVVTNPVTALWVTALASAPSVLWESGWWVYGRILRHHKN